MKKIITIILTIFIIQSLSLASTFQGGISEEGIGTSHRIIDKNTGYGIAGATVSLPKQQYSVQTDENGFFDLNTQIDGTSILSVQKEDYKPYSATVNDFTLNAPVVIGIEKIRANELVLDSNMYHLGDNNYSLDSANASQFRMSSIGPFYTKRFTLKNLKPNRPVFLVIGSLIGLDTQMARTMGQNRIYNAFSSPLEVYFNGNKISDIHINGDGQKIKLPPALIRKNSTNELTLRTGHNIMQTAYIDYDDVEFMNLIIEN